MAESQYAKTQAELARRIGISRNALANLMRRRDRPKNNSTPNAYPVEEWKRFAHQTLSGSRSFDGRNGTDLDRYGVSERDKSIIEKNRLDARLKAIEIDEKMGELISREAVNRQIDTANGIVVSELRKSLGLELPPRLEGLSAVEIKRKLLGKLDSVLEQLPKKFERTTSNGTG